jgi:translation initiation factor IF-2
MPEVGSEFVAFASKKEVEKYQEELRNAETKNTQIKEVDTAGQKRIPLIIKTDVAGTIEALVKEIEKINLPEIYFKIIGKGVGAINESDLKMANINKDTVVVGFTIKMDRGAQDLNETLKVRVESFDIIYKLTDWLKELIEERRPRQEVLEVTGSIKILKVFSATKDKQVIGGKVLAGRITLGGIVRIMRRDFEIGKGKIVELQTGKIKTKEVLETAECGMQVESKVEISGGDILEAFILTVK